jgi:hypothetical protein
LVVPGLLIGRETWVTLCVNIKGDTYKGRLEKNAADVQGGAGELICHLLHGCKVRTLLRFSPVVESTLGKLRETIAGGGCSSKGRQAKLWKCRLCLATLTRFRDGSAPAPARSRSPRG